MKPTCRSQLSAKQRRRGRQDLCITDGMEICSTDAEGGPAMRRSEAECLWLSRDVCFSPQTRVKIRLREYSLQARFSVVAEDRVALCVVGGDQGAALVRCPRGCWDAATRGGSALGVEGREVSLCASASATKGTGQKPVPAVSSGAGASPAICAA